MRSGGDPLGEPPLEQQEAPVEVRQDTAVHEEPPDLAPQPTGSDTGECRPVRNAQPPGMPMASAGRGWQPGGHPLPQIIRHSGHLPTKIVEHKTGSSTHSETIS